MLLVIASQEMTNRAAINASPPTTSPCTVGLNSRRIIWEPIDFECRQPAR